MSLVRSLVGRAAVLVAVAGLAGCGAKNTSTALDLSAEPTVPTERPFLWMIDADPPSYLYGTIHIPDDRVLDLPAVVSLALDASDVLYTEIPFDMATQMAAAGRMMFTDGRTLRDVIPGELYDRVSAYVSAKGAPMGMAMFNPLRPFAVATQLGMLDYLDDLMGGTQPLDAMLSSDFETAGGEIDAIETLEEQLAVFESLTEDEQVMLLEQTLDMLEAETEMPAMEMLVRLYLYGDTEQLAVFMNDQLAPGDDALSDKLSTLLLHDRNIRMADRIQAILGERPDEAHFFAIGAGHYPEDDGLLALLREKGFTVRRLTADDTDQIPENLDAAG